MLTTHTAFPVVPGTMEQCEKAFLYRLYNCIEHYAHNPGFGVQQLAEDMQLSRAQLNRKLSQLLGHSALKLITDYRFYKAKQLLCETDVPVKAIAVKCGFSRHGAFCRSFTAAFSYSPSHFRDAYRARNGTKPLRWKIPLQEEDLGLLQQLVIENSWLHDLLKMVINQVSDEVFTIEQLASAAGMSVNMLVRRTKALFQVAPQRFIRDIRLQYACEMLAGGQLTIAGIAYETGFFDPAHFSRCFKATIGCAPSEYEPYISVASIHRLKEMFMHQNGK